MSANVKRILVAAVKAAKEIVETKATKPHVKQLEAAEGALADYTASQSGNANFSNLREVASFLVKEGWKVSESTIYNHQKEGRIQPDDKGQYQAKAAQAYARTWLSRLDGADASIDERFRVELATKKSELELKELTVKKAKGELIEIATVKFENAAKSALLVGDFRTWCYTFAPELCQELGVGAQHVPKVIKLLHESTATFFDRYAGKKNFTVEMAALDSDD